MALRLSHTTFDARDPYTVAEFWRTLLDWQIQEPDSYHPHSDECYLVSPDGYTVLFLANPDPKTTKNRAHLDLVPHHGTERDTEICRALTLGARIVQDLRDSLGWAVLADPEGNEFCILQD